MTPGIGAFAVHSRVATVSVVGTSFSVKLLESKRQEKGRSSRKPAGRLAVAVTAGSVRVEHNGGVVTVSAGSQRDFAEEPAPGPNLPYPCRESDDHGKRQGSRRSRRQAGQQCPHATVTVTKDGAQAVYYVYGWAGMIIAKQADGKKVEVTGSVR